MNTIYRDDTVHGVAYVTEKDAISEINQLKGENGVLIKLLAVALEPIESIEAENDDEERMLKALVNKIKAALGGKA
jgi:hypothetical protein